MDCARHKTYLILAVMATALVNFSAARGQPGPRKYQVSTACLTEIREGKKSCWGVVITFDNARFRKRISPQQLKVSEAKHGYNLIDLMKWRVSQGGRRLTIKFKPGTGDFGTGNQAEVTLFKTAFAQPPKDFPDHLVLVQRTDMN